MPASESACWYFSNSEWQWQVEVVVAGWVVALFVLLWLVSCVAQGGCFLSCLMSRISVLNWLTADSLVLLAVFAAGVVGVQEEAVVAEVSSSGCEKEREASEAEMVDGVEEVDGDKQSGGGAIVRESTRTSVWMRCEWLMRVWQAVQYSIDREGSTPSYC